MARFSRAKQLSTRVAMMPRDLNAQGHIFGGVLLSNIDLAGAIAIRQAASDPASLGKMVTRAMDQVEFKKPVHVNDVLTCYARITRVGRSSVSVHVDVDADRNGTIIPVTKADLVYVHVDDDDKPLAIPGVRRPRKTPSAPAAPQPVAQPVGERVLALRKTMLPFETNGMGNIFGGVLLSHMDLAGSFVARRACPNTYVHRCVTRFMDKVEFKQPVKVGDVVTCYGSVLSIGETSIKVHVEVEVDRAGKIIPVTSADMVFVAVDEQGRPTAVACSIPSTKCGA